MVAHSSRLSCWKGDEVMNSYCLVTNSSYFIATSVPESLAKGTRSRTVLARSRIALTLSSRACQSLLEKSKCSAAGRWTNDQWPNYTSTNDQSANDQPPNDPSRNDQSANDQLTNDLSATINPQTSKSANIKSTNDQSGNDQPTNDPSTNDQSWTTIQSADSKWTNDQSMNDQSTTNQSSINWTMLARGGRRGGRENEKRGGR